MNHTFAYDVSFSRDSSDVFYPDSSELAKILMAVIVVLFTSAVSLRYFVGEGTKAYGKSLLTVTMVTMLCVQYYQLWFAVLTLPVDFLSSAYRWDCLRSDKGGKVALGDVSDHMVNPCFAHKNTTCTLSTGKVYLGSGSGMGGVYNVSQVLGLNVTSTEACVADTGAKSDFKGKDIPRFLEDMAERDCQSGKKSRCSLSEPCTPCELERKSEFKERWSRCAQCSTSNTGKCGFVPDEGPYCFKSATSREVVPCTKCCTEPTLFFDEEGNCS
ncbi:hypothetical protein TrCOL_g10949 [Triparma columacea]|uniref:Uncharacterized protein n=1 Tax=Triparma columacea TaxID=722753 RepID=A0A9W7LC73_9STRA|nr:hypothetical protein TrCOL_g10949 [Triparma columacea]